MLPAFTGGIKSDGSNTISTAGGAGRVYVGSDVSAWNVNFQVPTMGKSSLGATGVAVASAAQQQNPGPKTLTRTPKTRPKVICRMIVALPKSEFVPASPSHSSRPLQNTRNSIYRRRIPPHRKTWIGIVRDANVVAFSDSRRDRRPLWHFLFGIFLYQKFPEKVNLEIISLFCGQPFRLPSSPQPSLGSRRDHHY